MCSQGQEVLGCGPGELRSNSGQMGNLRNKEGWALVGERAVAVLQCFEGQSQHEWWGALEVMAWWTRDLVDLC